MRKVAVLAFAAAFLAVLGVVSAQTPPTKFSHYVAGDFNRADQVRFPDKLARWVVGEKWLELPPLARILGTGSVRDVAFHPTDNNIAFLMIRSGGEANNEDFVVKYDMTLQTYVILGETFPSASLDDIYVWGDSLYVSGNGFGFNGNRLTDPNFMGRRLLTADHRSGWEAFPNDNALNIGGRVNKFVTFGTGTNPGVALRSTNRLFWRRTNDGTWTNLSDDANIGVNLRGPGGSNAPTVNKLEVSGNYMWIEATASDLEVGATTGLRFLRSTDGRTWDPVLAPGNVPNFTFRYGVYDAVADGVYCFGVNTATTPSREGFFFIPRGSTTPTQLGENMVHGANPADTNTKIFRFNNRIVVLHRTDLALFVEPADPTDPNVAQYRSRRRLATGVSSIDPAAGASATWTAGLGGGLTASDFSGITWDATTRWAISPDGNTLLVARSTIGNGFNVPAYGLAAYHGESNMWYPYGTPLADGFISNLGDTARNLKVVNHYNNDDGTTQTVIIGGLFRRINNGTMNSLAWSDSNAPGTWNPFGNAGVATRGGQITPSTTGLYYDTPGQVHAMVAMPDPERRTSARVVFVGGAFAQSGDVAINNVGRYYLKGSNTWSNMKGGVSVINAASTAVVYALDYSGRRLFVGGSFTRAGNTSALNIAMWDDERQTWSNLGSGLDGTVYSILANRDSDVWVAGTFTSAGGMDTAGIARWDGSKWVLINCDRCELPCERDKVFTCITSGTGLELKNINNQVHLRLGSSLYVYDGSKFRKHDGFDSTRNNGNLVMTKAFESERGYNVLVASSTRSIANDMRNNWLVVNLENQNHAKNMRGGFDATVTYVSGASMSSPMAFLAMLAAVIAALLL